MCSCLWNILSFLTVCNIPKLDARLSLKDILRLTVLSSEMNWSLDSWPGWDNWRWQEAAGRWRARRNSNILWWDNLKKMQHRHHRNVSNVDIMWPTHTQIYWVSTNTPHTHKTLHIHRHAAFTQRSCIYTHTHNEAAYTQTCWSWCDGDREEYVLWCWCELPILTFWDTRVRLKFNDTLLISDWILNKIKVERWWGRTEVAE